MLELPVHPRLARMIVDAAPDDVPTACALAALLDERDVLSGPPAEVPVDLALRLELLADPGRSHRSLSIGALRRARHRSAQLAERAGAATGPIRPARAGPLVALAYPDRIALHRGRAGRFTLRSGPEALVEPRDPLAGAEALVVADLDGARRGARVRLAAALDPLDLLEALGDAVEVRSSLVWDRSRDDLVERTEQRVDALALGTTDRRADPGPATTAALVERVRATRLTALGGPRPPGKSGGAGDRRRSGGAKGRGSRPATTAPGAPAGDLRARVAYLRRLDPDRWPDWSDRGLLSDLDLWLAPLLEGARGRGDLEALDLEAVLLGRLDPTLRAELDRVAPERLDLGAGRSVRLSYRGEGVRAAVRVSDLFGTTVHPLVAGEPVILELLSPADRPLQVTTDLPGFWAGSWEAVRAELLGRYPTHDWPADPRNVGR